jgi:hypothetical protein
MSDPIMCGTRTRTHNPALNLVPFSRWTPGDKAMQAVQFKRSNACISKV